MSLSATVKEKHEVYYGCCVPLLSLYLWFDSDHSITVFALLVDSLRSTYPRWPGYVAHPPRPGIEVDLKSFSSPFSPGCNVWHQSLDIAISSLSPGTREYFVPILLLCHCGWLSEKFGLVLVVGEMQSIHDWFSPSFSLPSFSPSLSLSLWSSFRCEYGCMPIFPFLNNMVSQQETESLSQLPVPVNEVRCS